MEQFQNLIVETDKPFEHVHDGPSETINKDKRKQTFIYKALQRG